MKKIILLFCSIFSLSLTAQVTYFENFDVAGSWTGVYNAYGVKTYTNSADPVNDMFSSNLAWRETDYYTSSPYAWRIQQGSNYYFRYECQETVQAFQVKMARWDNSPVPNVTIRYSVNSGSTYTTITTITGSYFSADKVYVLYSYTFPAPISPDPTLKVYIEFLTTTGERMLYDDFQLTYLSALPLNPTSFDAIPASTTQNNILWALNTSSDSVMVAYNAINTFGNPSGVYSIGQEISGGGTVLYKGTGTSTSHSGLNPNTEYYYKAWSKGASGLYSTGVTDSSTTYKIQPSEYPALFAVADTGITITATWTDA
ncbi:MAG TPA: hypothetical protein PLR01_13645, partial [Bacteroidales bacterium]|nr:hypothetical protein [Bacteroidales bacterium]